MKNCTLLFLVMGYLLSTAQDGTSMEMPGENDQQSVEEQPDMLWEKANTAYGAENYEKSITLYKRILEQEKHSSDLYFNLANAYYKLNETGESIYYYEKALMLNPDDPEIQSNLAFAERMRMDQIEPLPDSETGTMLSGMIKSLSVDEWAYLGLVALLLAVLFFILYRYTVPTVRKRIFFVVSILLLLVFILCSVAAYYGKSYMDDRDFAIIMEEEITARDEPRNTSSSPFTLHEGTKVELLEDFRDWTKIVLSNGSRAWLPTASFREL